MSERFLFIGGSYDGRREVLADNHSVVRVAVHKPLLHPAYGFPEPIGFNQDETYIKRVMACGDKRHFAFFHQSIREEDMMQVLLDNYQPKP